MVYYDMIIKHNVDDKRFAGLNMCGFSAIKVFTEIFLHYLGRKCSLFSTIKRGTYIHRKTFVILQKTMKNESLAQ